MAPIVRNACWRNDVRLKRGRRRELLGRIDVAWPGSLVHRRSVRTRRAERPDAWPPTEVALDPGEEACELILKDNERDDHSDRKEHDAHRELEILGATIASSPAHILRTRNERR